MYFKRLYKTVNNSKESKLKPWTIFGLITSIRKRDQLNKKLKLQPFNVPLKSCYLNYRNTLSQLIKTTKQEYYKNKIDQSNGDFRKIWNVINDITENENKKLNYRNKIDSR